MAQHHGGSALCLLCLLQLANGAFWLALYALYARLPVAFCRLALPALAAQALCGSRNVCRWVMEAGAAGAAG